MPVKPALGAEPTTQPLGSARDAIPITASSANNVFGKPYTAAAGGDARACKALLASATTTFTGVMATGETRTGVIIQAGITPLQVIQITSITGGSLWALI